MGDKRMSAAEVIGQIKPGMTVGIGGWGSRRKPMSLVREILRSELKDLSIVSYGGPDVGLLCASGKVRKIVFGFVSLDSIPVDPHFRNARQGARIEVEEYDEGMLQWGLYAAALRLPFLPTRAGLGSDVLTVNPHLRLVADPYGGDTLVAMPALHLDVALVHMNRADRFGNGQFLGPDPYFDDLFCMAADKAFMSCERVVETEEFTVGHHPSSIRIPRAFVTGVVEAPGGAGFTSCEPDYLRNESLLKEYAKSAESPDAWASFFSRYTESAKNAEGDLRERVVNNE